MPTFCKIVLLTAIISIAGCTYDNPMTVCLHNALDRYDMEKYEGQEIKSCELLLYMYEWKGEYYFDSGSYCIDISFLIPEDCSGLRLSPDYTDSIHLQFQQEAISLGIVGIQ